MSKQLTFTKNPGNGSYGVGYLQAEAGIPHSVAERFSRVRPVFQYDNGPMAAHYLRTEIWRDTNEPAGFYSQGVMVNGRMRFERYIIVYRKGRFVPIEQWGTPRGYLRRFLGVQR